MKAKAHLADAWKHNALFRMLAFLDTTGEQPFVLEADIDADGKFLRPDALFCHGTAIHAVLAAGLEALRQNCCYLFSDAQERDAVLAVLGMDPATTCGQEEPLNRGASPSAPAGDSTAVTTAIATATATTAATENSGVGEGADTLEAPQPQPRETDGSRALTQPESLETFAEAFNQHLPLNLACRLEEVMSLPSSTYTTSPAIEQFLIDAVDHWMSRRSEEENQRLVQACGVQPVVVEAAVARRQELPHALVDFVVDVVFPRSEDMAAAAGEGGTGAPLQDWLLQAYQHNHETVDVEAESTGSEGAEADVEGEERATAGNNVGKRPRAVEEGDGLNGWQPPDDEVILTADNVDRYMRENPSLVPREIIREKRRSWLDPAITVFELEHHYTAAELKSAVKELAGLAEEPNAALTAWEEAAAREHGYNRGSATPQVCRRAAAASRKADCIDAIVRLHGPTGEDAADSTSGEMPTGATQEEEGGEKAALAVDDPSLSAARLVKLFTLGELQEHIREALGEAKPPATKKACATLIIKKRSSQ